MRSVLGLSALAGSIDALLIDQFGTIHDGSRPYPGVVGALRQLGEAAKRVVVITNSGKRAAANVGRLTRMGIDPALYHGLVSSGEIGWSALAQRPAGQLCLLLARDDDRSVLDGTGAIVTRDPLSADLVVIAGSEGERTPLAQYEDLLRPAAQRGVPAMCLNPDRVMLTAAGPAFGAGQIAACYERLGGSVRWIGKPFAPLFEAALALLPGIPRERVAVLGDSVEHDIAGARRVGCRAVLVRTGIIAEASDSMIEAECDRFCVRPDEILAALRW